MPGQPERAPAAVGLKLLGREAEKCVPLWRWIAPLAARLQASGMEHVSWQ